MNWHTEDSKTVGHVSGLRYTLQSGAPGWSFRWEFVPPRTPGRWGSSDWYDTEDEAKGAAEDHARHH